MSSWGGSWGVSWGDSWGTTIPPTPPDVFRIPQPSLIPVFTDTHDRHKLAVQERQRRDRRRRREEEELIALGIL